jgi:hypothetical protein
MAVGNGPASWLKILRRMFFILTEEVSKNPLAGRMKNILTKAI